MYVYQVCKYRECIITAEEVTLHEPRKDSTTVGLEGEAGRSTYEGGRVGTPTPSPSGHEILEGNFLASAEIHSPRNHRVPFLEFQAFFGICPPPPPPPPPPFQ